MSTENSLKISKMEYIYSIINSCVLKKECKVTMFVPLHFPLYIFPFEEEVSDLKAKLSDGKFIPILTYDRIAEILRRRLSIKITDDMVNIESIQNIVGDSFNLSNSDVKNYKYFAIIELPKKESEYYEEITFSWLISIENERKYSDPFTLEIPLKIDFQPMHSTIYVDIRVDEKFELRNQPALQKFVYQYYGLDNQNAAEVLVDLKEGEEYRFHIYNKHHWMIMLTSRPNNLRLSCVVGVQSSVHHWAWVGFFLGIGTSISALIFGFPDEESKFFPLIGGSIAGLIALRVVLFHDVELLKIWHRIYIVLVSSLILTIVILIVF